MSKRKKVQQIEKEPVAAATASDSVNSSRSSTLDDKTNVQKSQAQGLHKDNEKGRHFWYVVYPESAPDDWIERLTNTGLAFCVSPLHDKDTNADGSKKKAHWHVIISWGNTTTYRNAKGLCDMLNCPFPQMLKRANGAYRYHQHLDNPEKYQYTESSKTYNGWERPLETCDIDRIMDEIRLMVLLEDCMEYGELCSICAQWGPEYSEVVKKHTMFFGAICRSYRHSPLKNLKRALPEFKSEAEQERIRELIEKYNDYQGEKSDESDY